MSEQTFNPNEHLMQIKSGQTSKDYLPVQWRLVWFRSLCPQGTIETELVLLDLDRETEEEVFVWNNEKRRSEKVIKKANGIAVFRAIVKDGKGGIATGTKSEKAASFGDFIEKSETGAIGRALAALGYGTQFTGDEWNESHRIVDSPVDRAAAAESGNGNGYGASGSTNGNGAARRPVVSAVRPVPTNGVSKTNGNTSGLHAVPTAANGSSEAEGEATTATEQQLTSIRKLCERLGKPEPENPDALSFNGAKELIGQLTQEYRSRKAS